MALSNEIYTRLIKKIVGQGSGQITIPFSPRKRIHELLLQLTYAGGTNTLAALMTSLTEIRWKRGTDVISKMTGTQLRDWMLLHGTTYDFNGLPNTGAQVTIPFAPEWFSDPVAHQLAWNPITMNGEITVEIDSSANLTVVAYESISDDIDVPGMGVLTYQVIKPVVGSTDIWIEDEIEPRGLLAGVSIYPDSGGTNEPTPVSLALGSSNVYAYERLTSAQNDEALERKGLTPAATGRTANIYDIIPVKSDMLTRAWNLLTWGLARIRIEAAAAMSGTSSILLVRLEQP